MEKYKEQICGSIDQKASLFTKVNDAVWAASETGFREYQSAKILIEALQSEGFAIEEGIAGIPTAFVATYGQGKPVIAYLGEYDALSSLSQKAGVPWQAPVVSGGNGHGCGHNVLGAGSMAAAVALKEHLQKTGVSGTVKYFGCPGEEYGSGKMFMAREGYFDDVDAAFTWHPGAHNGIFAQRSLANISVFFRFYGKTAHAAAIPHLGRSALDAAELMNVGVNYMREHMPLDCRVHYAYRDVGGTAPNVVQETACLIYFVRAPRVKQALELTERVHNIAKGASLMTETRMEMQISEALCDYVPNDVLGHLLLDCFKNTGGPAFDDADYSLAKQFTFSEAEKEAALATIANASTPEAAKNVKDCVLIEDILPYGSGSIVLPGSTDVGDTSYATPTAQLNAACWAVGTPGHSWQVTSQSGSSIAHKGLLAAGKALALAGVCCLYDGDLLKRAREEYIAATGGQYVCPVADDVKPDIE